MRGTGENTDSKRSLCNRLESLFLCDCTAADIDIFHARTESTVRQEVAPFSLGPVRYRAIDVGGTWPERGKVWHTLYPYADYVVFTVALSGYCRLLSEDSSVVSGPTTCTVCCVLTFTRIK